MYNLCWLWQFIKKLFIFTQINIFINMIRIFKDNIMSFYTYIIYIFVHGHAVFLLLLWSIKLLIELSIEISMLDTHRLVSFAICVPIIIMGESMLLLLALPNPYKCWHVAVDRIGLFFFFWTEASTMVYVWLNENQCYFKTKLPNTQYPIYAKPMFFKPIKYQPIFW